MKGMKGKILKKLKSIGQMSTLKTTSRMLQVNASDGLFDPFPPKSCHVFQDQTVDNLSSPKSDIFDVAELMRDLGEEDEEMEFAGCSAEKENIRPSKISTTMKENSEIESRNTRNSPLSELHISSFRRPELNSGTLFDPSLLEAFQQAVKHQLEVQEPTERSKYEAENICKDDVEEEPPNDPLFEFEERCPPGGSDTVVLYTTSIRGIRKTFEDCSSIKFLLGSMKVLYSERDVSMHMEFREELWRISGGRVVPPRLFIRGRYIGGADEVLELHEQGKLRWLVKGIALDRSGGKCRACGGFHFLPCVDCNGSCKIVYDDEASSVRCPNCNENGLIVCPLCR